MIDKVHWIDKEKLVKLILDYRDVENGGIFGRPDDAVDVYHTYFGVAALFCVRVTLQTYSTPPTLQHTRKWRLVSEKRARKTFGSKNGIEATWLSSLSSTTSHFRSKKGRENQVWNVAAFSLASRCVLVYRTFSSRVFRIESH